MNPQSVGLILGFALLLPGCAAHRCQCVQSAPEPTRVVRLQDPSTIPVLAHSRFNPVPLSNEQRYDIMHRAVHAMPDGTPIWFIALKTNSIREGKPDWAVNVYFMPHMETARLRKGRWISVCARTDESSAFLDQLTGRDDTIGGAFRRPMPTYVQVAHRYQPFHGERTLPVGFSMPFRTPENISDDEVIALFDFAYPSLPKTTDPDPQSPDAPIICLERKGEEIYIRKGVHEDFLVGGGTFQTVVPESGTYRIVSSGQWVY